MQCRIRDLRCKEVINICDGCRIGYVEDVDVRIPEGQVGAVVVYGPCRFFGLWGRRDDYVIPWRCIRKMGPDIVLVDVKPEECRVPRQKPGLLFG